MKQYFGVVFYWDVLFESLIRIIFILCLFFGNSEKLIAAEINCVPGIGTTTTDFQIAPVNITVSANMADYTVLYTMQQRINNGVSADCRWVPAGGQPAQLAATLTNTAGPGDTSQYGYIIFPTNESGIGISVNSSDAGELAVPAWPAVLVTEDALVGSRLRYQNVTIRLWKIPGDLSTANSPVGIIGPAVIQGIVPATSADYFSSATLASSQSFSAGYWMISERNLIGNANYYIGTCNLRNNHQTVLLGKHMNFTRFSSWHDASFTMDCPVRAYGYGGMNNVTPNNKNKPPAIKIVPYTAPILSDHLGNIIGGTIALDPGGAQGYGVQLAWGDYTTQGLGVNPASAVPFNTSVPVNTLVSGYPAALTMGSTAPSAIIKMAARFIQTETIPQAGTARASIEVIIGYQ